MKRFGIFLAVLMMAVSLFSMTAFANETCALADDGEACEVWWFYDQEQHWRACVTHEDHSGNDILVTDPEVHEFVDGICTVCERTEVSGFFLERAYWIIFALVAGAGFIVVSLYRSPKLGRDEVTTFGLDKFKKIR